jgi:hypothetical protein
MEQSPAPTTDSTALHVGPAVAGWLVPGLGHVWLGQRKRGLILLAGIYGLFMLGLLIGGIDVVDYQEDTLWFAGQACAGPPALIVGYIHQQWKVKHAGWRYPLPPDPPSQGHRPPYEVSIGRVNELGTLYCAMAGLLNLLAIVDVIYRPKPLARTPTARGKVVRREASA